jgi:hypothetical protein
MRTEDLIKALDNRYGNPHATDCDLIQEGIKALQELLDENRAYEKFIAVNELEKLQND